MDLGQIWYIIFVFLMIGYAVLDGFDLGAGALHLFAKTDLERRTILSAIGPVWDGNEVWLVVIGGALFAGFPAAYAAIFSAFYNPMMLLIFCLIFRAVSIEFRSKVENKTWRMLWDMAFSFGSIGIALSLGLVLGNFVQGIPVNEEGEFLSDSRHHLHGYSLLVAITTLALFMMHGSLYLLLKTEGVFQQNIRKWAMRSLSFFVVCYLLLTASTALFMPHMLGKVVEQPLLIAISVVNIILMVTIGVFIKQKKEMKAFLSSAACIALLITVYAIGSYPVLLRASNHLEDSLTVFNSVSSDYTLKVLLFVVCLGMPLAVLYMVHTYKVFRGKVKEDSLMY